MEPPTIHWVKIVHQGTIPLDWDANFIAIQILKCLDFQTIWTNVHIQNSSLTSLIVVKILQRSRVDRVHKSNTIVSIAFIEVRIAKKSVASVVFSTNHEYAFLLKLCIYWMFFKALVIIINTKIFTCYLKNVGNFTLFNNVQL